VNLAQKKKDNNKNLMLLFKNQVKI